MNAPNENRSIEKEARPVSTPPNPPLTMEAWVAFLGAHARVVPQVDKDLKSAFGISLTWFDVLYQLSLIPERRLRMQELADALLLSKSGLTRLVDRIEKEGLVARQVVPGDRRSLYVALTPAGKDLVEKARPFVRGSVEMHFTSGLTDEELTVLRDALARVGRAGAEAGAGQNENGRRPNGG